MLRPEQYQIKLVDGLKIRQTLDDDFGIIGLGSSALAIEKPKFWIPEGELWVDHRYHDEADFLIELEFFTTPDATASYAEKRVLAKSKFCNLGPETEYVRRRESKGGLTICDVDGAVVRRRFDPEFILGGHPLVYDYIPAGEIWLDAKMDPAERAYILLHEEVEYKLMKESKPYHIAHEYATVADKELRRADGAVYAGDPGYSWYSLSNQEIIKQYYATNS